MPDLKDVIYAAFKLLPCEGLERLRNLVTRFDANVFCHHMTLGFGANVSNYHINNVGRIGKIHFIRYIEDMRNNIGCVSVCETDARKWGCVNLFPHITVYTHGDTKPVESNNLVKRFYEGDDDLWSFETPEAQPLLGMVDLFIKTPDGKAKWFLE